MGEFFRGVYLLIGNFWTKFYSLWAFFSEIWANFMKLFCHTVAWPLKAKRKKPDPRFLRSHAEFEFRIRFVVER